jgi:tRNA (guanine-N7-)-methyltransferase
MAYPSATIDWAEVFGDDHPVELEVGPGKGLYLEAASQARPGHNFVGVEIAPKYARLAAERLIKHGAPANVRLTAGDAHAMVRDRVPAASLRAVHVYFPDPWWKTRHRKRRVFSDAFLADVIRALEPRGELHIATDVEEYHGVMLRTVAASQRFEPIDRAVLMEGAGDAHAVSTPITNFERKYRVEGRPIHRASFRLR